MKRLLVLLLFSGMAFAQKPVATLPTGISGGPNGPFAGTVIDTTYALPIGGTTCAAHTRHN